MQDTSNKASTLLETAKRLGSLYIENVRLTVTEKISIFLGAIALIAVVMILGLTTLVFLCIGIADLLASYIAPFWSYLIVAGVFALIIALLIIFKETLIYNPIARFVSKLILNPPKDN